MGRVGALARVLCEAIEDQGLHTSTDLRAPRAQRSRWLGNVLVCHLYRVARERRLPDRGVREGRAERVDVALGGNPLPAKLLRRGVGCRPEVGAGTVVARGPVPGPGDGEIGQFWGAPPVQGGVSGVY